MEGEIKSKPLSKQGRKNYDKIFGKQGKRCVFCSQTTIIRCAACQRPVCLECFVAMDCCWCGEIFK
jgi:hypothetical protein